MSQFRDRLAASAQSQAASPFFDRLPSEIRQQIYRDLWDLCDVRWHVHAFSARAVPVFQCLTHPDDDDTRYARFQAERGSDAAVWESRLRSPWNTHWRCAEAAAAELSRLERRRVPPDAHVRLRDVQLLAPLLVCRRMYIESVPELDNVFTFCFTDVLVARDFLAAHAPARPIRNVVLSLRVKPLLTELYFSGPGPDGAPQPRIIAAGLHQVTADRNPWEALCGQLAALPGLRSLHVRLDSEDLRPWHKRVNEARFFARLARARAARDFVLYLPDIPDEPERRGLPVGSYLEEGTAVDGAPFRVVRGPRPDNWQLHLSRISHALPETWSHTLWNQTRDKIWAA